MLHGDKDLSCEGCQQASFGHMRRVVEKQPWCGCAIGEKRGLSPIATSADFGLWMWEIDMQNHYGQVKNDIDSPRWCIERDNSTTDGESRKVDVRR